MSAELLLHTRHTVDVLSVSGASDFLAKLNDELGRKLSALEFVERINSMPICCVDEAKSLMAEMWNVKAALHALGGRTTPVQQDAAIALYILICCRVAGWHATQRTEDGLVVCERTEHVMYALMAAPLFGGKLIFGSSSGEFPKTERVYVLEPPAGAKDMALALLQSATLQMNATNPRTPELALDLPSSRMIEEFNVSVEDLRRLHKAAFVFVIRDSVGIEAIRNFVARYNAPTIVERSAVSGECAAEMLGVSIDALIANFRSFWLLLAASRSQNEVNPMPTYPPQSPAPVVHIQMGDKSTLALTTGDRSPAHSEHHSGTKLDELRPILAELLKVLAPAADTLDPATKAAIDEVSKQALEPSPQFSMLSNALAKIKNGVGGVAALAGSVEKIGTLISHALLKAS